MLLVKEIVVRMQDDKTGAPLVYTLKDGKIIIAKDGKDQVLDDKVTKLICEQMNCSMAMVASRL